MTPPSTGNRLSARMDDEKSLPIADEYARMSVAFTLLKILEPLYDDTKSLVELINNRSQLFRDVKICVGIVARSKKKQLCGKIIKGTNTYCANCVKKPASNGTCSLQLSPIGAPGEGLYWNQKNDHIYRMLESQLYLVGIRNGSSISENIPESAIEQAKSMRIGYR